MKTLLLTISTTALILAGQSAMALEQINTENGYDPMARNGRVSETYLAELPVASFKNDNSTKLGFNGGSENDTGNITFTFPVNHADALPFSGGSENH